MLEAASNAARTEARGGGRQANGVDTAHRASSVSDDGVDAIRRRGVIVTAREARAKANVRVSGIDESPLKRCQEEKVNDVKCSFRRNVEDRYRAALAPFCCHQHVPRSSQQDVIASKL